MLSATAGRGADRRMPCQRVDNSPDPRRRARQIPARKDERCGDEKGAGDDRRVAKGGEEGVHEEQDIRQVDQIKLEWF
jgi:hypothetical protein